MSRWKPSLSSSGREARRSSWSGSARLEKGTFEGLLEYARQGDFVYLAPPYQPLSKTSNFTDYTRSFFRDDDLKRLARCFRTLHERGCRGMLSNSDAPLVRELYKDFFVLEVMANRAINSNAAGRGAITELVVTSYPASEAG
jgi:DNA adenine methylase